MNPSRLFPELNLLESKEQRQEICNSAFWRLLRKPWFWILLVGVPGVIALFLAIGLIWLRRVLPAVQGHEGLINGIIISVTFGGGFQFIFRRPLRRQIRLELIAQGIPICIHCGYDLRAQLEPRCPECGHPFDAGLIRPKST